MGYFKCLDAVLSDIENIPEELEGNFGDFLSFEEVETVEAEPTKAPPDPKP